jgi:plasmid maintenance system antidote protein VapI
MGKSNISPEMALRLSKVLGRSPESWLALQDHYNLWQVKQQVNLDNVQNIEFIVENKARLA